MTGQSSITAADVHTLRDAAARLVSRLGLAGYDNASIRQKLALGGRNAGDRREVLTETSP